MEMTGYAFFPKIPWQILQESRAQVNQRKGSDRKYFRLLRLHSLISSVAAWKQL